MGADWTDGWGDGSQGGGPAGLRQYGMRPFGRQYGMRPEGKQYGMRPFGRQYGMRPEGKQYGMRPEEPPMEAAGGLLDTEEWGADIADLFCDYSAVLRLGARLVFDVSELAVPVQPMQYAPKYLPPTVAPDIATPSAPEGAEADDAAAAIKKAVAAGNKELTKALEDSSAMLVQHRLRPAAHELAVQVVMRNRLFRALTDHPDIAWAVKQDIAHALALRADQGFLHGDPAAHGPHGIAGTKRVLAQDDESDSRTTVRAMVSRLRAQETRFADAGWVLHPSMLDELSDELAGAQPNAEGQLLTHDGADGGTLLGYPFVVSAATADDLAHAETRRIYFSSDWGEAWIGAERPLASVDVSQGVRFQTDETVIRAVMQHDFALRSPEFFICSKRPVRAGKSAGTETA